MRVIARGIQTSARRPGSMPRVSHFMNKFRKLGLIDYNGHIEVHNSLLSAVLHDNPQLREHE